MIKWPARIFPFVVLSGISLFSGIWVAAQTPAPAVKNAPATTQAQAAEATRILDELLVLCVGKPAFNAMLRLNITGNTGLPQNFTLDLPFATQNGQIRFDLDLNKIKPATGADTMAEVTSITGSQVTILASPGLRTAWLIFPGLKALVELKAPPPLGTQTGMSATGSDAPETVAGFECRKKELHFTGSQDKTVVLSVWQATKLQKFPVKLQIAHEQVGVLANLPDIRMQNPDPAQFKLPEGYTRYNNMQELVAAVLVQKMMNPPK